MHWPSRPTADTSQTDAPAVALAEWRATVAVALAIVAFTLTGFFIFPGHTYLGSDTQIYLPLLERLRDPGLFSRELIAIHPHLSFTLYDEIALAFRRLTSVGFEPVLTAQQLVFRGLALWGVYLIATGAGFSRRVAVMVCGVYALGATVPGPALLTVEYEPVPRGFALALLLLAIGLTARGRLRDAGLAASGALMLQAPVTLPFWMVYAWLVWRKRRWQLLIAPVASGALLLLFWRLQPGGPQVQAAASRIGPAWEEILRLRASYVWVSTWPVRQLWQYAILCAVSLVAAWRLWKRFTPDQRALWLVLPITGLASIPASYLLLEWAKWPLAPQLQPARYALFITLSALLLSAMAGTGAAQARRWTEACGWMLLVFALPVHGDLFAPWTGSEALVVVLLTALSVAAVIAAQSPRWFAAIPCTAVVIAAMFAIPYLGGVRNFADLRSQSLDELIAWSVATPRDALFHFPDAGRSLNPGIFRVRALRAVYVDWKGGGQANFFEDTALEWSRRWKGEMTNRPNVSHLQAVGIDYVIVSPRHRLPKLVPVFENRDYVVYGVR